MSICDSVNWWLSLEINAFEFFVHSFCQLKFSFVMKKINIWKNLSNYNFSDISPLRNLYATTYRRAHGTLIITIYRNIPVKHILRERIALKARLDCVLKLRISFAPPSNSRGIRVRKYFNRCRKKIFKIIFLCCIILLF